MAKIKGALFSMEARGGFANNIVFTVRKGQPVARQLVTPANPQSADQEKARNIVRITGALQRFANNTALKQSGQTKTDKVLLTAAAPSNQTWNSYLTQSVTGKDQVNYDAAKAAYTALTSPQKSAWESAAGALTPAILEVGQKEAGGVSGTPIAAGEVFFVYCYGLSLAGIGTTPGATPTVYS